MRGSPTQSRPSVGIACRCSSGTRHFEPNARSGAVPSQFGYVTGDDECKARGPRRRPLRSANDGPELASASDYQEAKVEAQHRAGVRGLTRSVRGHGPLIRAEVALGLVAGSVLRFLLVDLLPGKGQHVARQADVEVVGTHAGNFGSHADLVVGLGHVQQQPVRGASQRRPGVVEAPLASSSREPTPRSPGPCATRRSG